jgi:Xaa-Pro aminopeptidase
MQSSGEGLHAVGVSAESREQAEAVAPKFVQEGIHRAQQRTWEAVDAIRQRVEVGMTEEDARVLAMAVLSERGVKKHWHRPYLRLGPGTTRTFHQRLQDDYRLEKGAPFFIDIGPVWHDEASNLSYEGDAGDTFIQGSDQPNACARAARALFDEGLAAWRTGTVTGQALYALLADRAKERGYTLLSQVDGHRVSDFPHHQYSHARLAELAFAPTPSRWVLEVHLIDEAAGLGAFYEDLLS